jgi:beta-lactamase superfamily II metal-dependent hydrolase
MARRKNTKRQVKKQVEKVAKKYPLLTFIVVLILVAAVIGGYFLHKKGIVNIPFFGEQETSETDEPVGGEVIVTDELSIHFLELGNGNTGDCTLIDIGDTEILIDAGSRKGSAKTIRKYIDQYCTDGTLEYVIATHADQDHIAAFVGESENSSRTGILYQYKVGTLVQFALTNKTTQIYKDYVSAVEYAKTQGTAVYTALECWNNANGASRSYTLADDITMNFLYQKYYEETTGDENDYSVCMLLTQGSNNYLFTGDLEKHGEASLVASNSLPKCKLFKGGHHGSPTSSTDALLSVIKPEIVCVCCCAGSDEYTEEPANMFPSQAFVDRIAPYTQKVYVTTMVADNANGYQSMNGNIVVSSSGGEVSVNCSNNNTLLKDTEWFIKNRIMPDAWRKSA